MAAKTLVPYYFGNAYFFCPNLEGMLDDRRLTALAT
jgi:hypothetical protein